LDGLGKFSGEYLQEVLSEIGKRRNDHQTEEKREGE